MTVPSPALALSRGMSFLGAAILPSLYAGALLASPGPGVGGGSLYGLRPHASSRGGSGWGADGLRASETLNELAIRDTNRAGKAIEETRTRLRKQVRGPWFAAVVSISSCSKSTPELGRGWMTGVLGGWINSISCDPEPFSCLVPVASGIWESTSFYTGTGTGTCHCTWPE